LAIGLLVIIALVAARGVLRHHSSVPKRTPHGDIGRSLAQVGSTYTLRGSVPGGKDGSVEVDGRWDGGAWHVLATTQALDGKYSISFPITQSGLLDVRVRYPGGEAESAVTVPRPR
jgi:hypothetical protein